MATEPEVKLTTSDTSAASKRVSGGQGGAQTVTVHEAVQHLLAGAGPRRIADPATTAMEDGCWMLHSRLMQEEGGNLGQLLWVKTYFAVARRTKSWVLTRDVLRMGNELGLGLPEVMSMMSMGNDHGSHDDAAPGELPMPPSMEEWFNGPEPCLVRIDHYGVIRYQPNQALVQAWSALGMDAHVMAAQQTEGFQSERDLIDDYWLRAFASLDDMQEVIRSWARALAKVGTVRPDNMRENEVDLEDEVLKPIYLCVNGHTIGPVRPRTRIAHRDGLRQIWEAVLVPLHGVPVIPPAALIAARSDSTSERDDLARGIVIETAFEQESVREPPADVAVDLTQLAGAMPLEDILDDTDLLALLDGRNVVPGELPAPSEYTHPHAIAAVNGGTSGNPLSGFWSDATPEALMTQ